jgi:hypothetical protein
LWHFARQKRKTWQAMLKLGKLNVYWSKDSEGNKGIVRSCGICICYLFW